MKTLKLVTAMALLMGLSIITGCDNTNKTTGTTEKAAPSMPAPTPGSIPPAGDTSTTPPPAPAAGDTAAGAGSSAGGSTGGTQ